MIVGTAGHIDHGKSALVRALTGVDPDRLKEEKEHGITLDLGYAYHEIDGRVLGFVDVPGHERLIHNMLAGATGIDYVVLVIAAYDGPMPQTLEHLQILELLGLTRGAVALTKIDRVDSSRRMAAEQEVHNLLASTRFADAPLFPLSSVTGEGVEALRNHLSSVAGNLPPRHTKGPFRLAVDRSFTIAGAGTVVTGTAYSGSVHLEDRPLLTPSGREVRVRSIHAQNRPADSGHAGQRCALNLAGLGKDEVRRGDWVVSPELHAPTQRFDVRLHLLAGEERPLKHWTPVHLHLGASHVNARIALLEGERLEPGGESFAQLVLESDMGVRRGDRFVVRDQSAQRTLGGGVVLDCAPPSRYRRTPQRLALLDAIHSGSPARVLACALEGSGNGVDLRHFAAEWSLDNYETATLLPMAVVPSPSGPWGFAQAQWDALGEKCLATLAEEHRTAPHRQGLDRERLRRRVAPALSRPAFGVLTNLEITGTENLPKSGPLIMVGNHFSFIDPVCFVRLSPWQIEFVGGADMPHIAAGHTDHPAVVGISSALSRHRRQRLAQSGGGDPSADQGESILESVRNEKLAQSQDYSLRLSRLGGRIAKIEALTETMNEKGPIRKNLAQADVAFREADLLLKEEKYRDLEPRLTRIDGHRREAEEALFSVLARYADEGQVARWRKWAEETVRESKRRGGTAIVVNKLERTLTIFRSGRPVRVCEMGLGRYGLSDKLHAGDEATPEGRVTSVNLAPPALA